MNAVEISMKNAKRIKGQFQQWYGASKYTQLGNPGQYLQPCHDAWVACAYQPSFQQQVFPWTRKVFGTEIAVHKPTRQFRFFEECVELVQSGGATRDQVMAVVDYVYNRPVGEMKQEVGGVMVTLAALCNAYDIDMADEGNIELERVQSDEMIEKIRKKQSSKPFNVFDVNAGVPTYVDPSKLMSKSERHIRRMLCTLYAGPAAYTDDGEAQDSRRMPMIDFLRMPPTQIAKCMTERALSENQPVIDKAREKRESIDEQADQIMLMMNGFTVPPTSIYLPELPSHRSSIRKVIVSIEHLKKNQNWEAVDRSLSQITMRQLDALLAVAIVRSTYAFRSHLTQWKPFLRQVMVEFSEPASLWAGFTTEDLE